MKRTAPSGERLEPLAVGPFACDHHRRAGPPGRFDQQVDPLRAVEPARPRGRSPRTRRSGTRSSCGGCGITSASSPVERCEALGDVARRREDLARFAERDLVELLDLAPDRPLLGRLAELAERGAVELVRLAELVDEPDHLVRMADDVRGELRRDHQVDAPAVRFLEVEQPPEERLRQDALAGIPLERHADEVGVVAAALELGDQVVGEDLDSAPGEGDLWTADGDSQVLATIA